MALSYADVVQQRNVGGAGIQAAAALDAVLGGIGLQGFHIGRLGELVQQERLQAHRAGIGAFAATDAGRCVLAAGLRYSHWISRDVGWRVAEALCFALLVVFGSMKFTVHNRVLEWLGKHTFEIFILQRLPMKVLSKAGAKVDSATWSAKLPAAEQERLAEELIGRGGHINFIKWETGSVLPESGRAMEHMASFDYGYKLAAVRDWLFRQSK